MAVISPKIDEIKLAVDRLGLHAEEVNVEAHFPQQPWVKSGSLQVEKKEPKEAIIKKIAKQLVKIKSENQA